MTSVKKCKKCGTEKPLSQFTKAPDRPDGVRNACRNCTAAYQAEWGRANRESVIARRRAWRAANRDKANASSLAWWTNNKERAESARVQRVYGLAPEDFAGMVRAQEGRCAVCGESPERSLHIDHDHDTGAVRGLLCNSCNLALGFLKDSPAVVERMLAYIRQHKVQVKAA